MKFVQIINRKKFLLITISLFLYVFINLVDGERGLISYYKNQKIKEQLIQKETSLVAQLNSIEKKNKLLTTEMDLDFLEILYRKKFMVGKSEEKVYIKR
tara:strand:+ start:96 stop:392 length:297 start_codon:yes stop_codon:yes gene_type:complete